MYLWFTYTGSPLFSCQSGFSRIRVARSNRRGTPMKVRKRRRTGRNAKKWVAKVKTDSTHPPPGLFTWGASTISRVLASKKVSPQGPQPECACSITSSTEVSAELRSCAAPNWTNRNRCYRDGLPAAKRAEPARSLEAAPPGNYRLLRGTSARFAARYNGL